MVVVPLGQIQDYLNAGRTYEYFESYFNPGGYFDEIYCLTPYTENVKIGKVQYINVWPEDFARVINEIQPDIIRAYAGFSCCDWVAANCIKDIPLVISVHDTNPNLINQSLKYADYIICMSEAVADAVKNIVIGIEENKLHIMPNRVDITKFYKRNGGFEELDKRYGKGKHILHVGRKSYQKNLETLIKAMQYLPLEYKAVFVGAGNADVYIRLAEECGVLDRCFLIGAVNKDELPLYYSWCDCMCTPSRYEGFGNVFIEAAACESLIIASNIAPMNEYLTDKVDSILVDDYENPKVLAEYIEKACNENEDVLKIRRNARLVGMKFEKEVIDEQEALLYKKFIATGTDNRKLQKLKEEQEKLDRKVIIFGAGKRGKDLADLLPKEKIGYFADNDKNKIVVEGYEEIALIRYEDLLKVCDQYTIVVTPLDREDIVRKLTADKVEYMEMDWYKLLLKKWSKEISAAKGEIQKHV